MFWSHYSRPYPRRIVLALLAIEAYFVFDGIRSARKLRENAVGRNLANGSSNRWYPWSRWLDSRSNSVDAKEAKRWAKS